MLFLGEIKRAKVWRLWKSGCNIFFLGLLMAVVTAAWGQTEALENGALTDDAGQLLVAKPQSVDVEPMPEAATVDEEERSFVNSEPREMAGIWIGAIVVNAVIFSTLVMWLLRQWRQHEPKKPRTSEKQSEQ